MACTEENVVDKRKNIFQATKWQTSFVNKGEGWDQQLNLDLAKLNSSLIVKM